MKSLFVAVALLMAAPSYAQFEMKGAGDPPETESEVQWLLKEAAWTGKRIVDLNKKIEDINDRGHALVRRIKAHNDQWPNGQCEYPEDDPHACDGWIAEAEKLNGEILGLRMEDQAANMERGMAKSHLGITMARLRLRQFLMLFSEWEQEVVGCSKLPNLETMHRCMADAWDRHP